MRGSIGSALLVLSVLGACGGDGPPPTQPEDTAERSCGDTTCSVQAFCVGTQGAVCMPLPPEGEACAEGCVKTEHCCNCTVYACVDVPEERCPMGPSCACLDEAGEEILPYCGPERRECSDNADGTDVLCVQVALDEDPFADD